MSTPAIRRTPRTSRRVGIGTLLAAMGALGLLAAIALNATGAGSDASWMPLVVGPSILALVAGMGATALRAVPFGLVWVAIGTTLRSRAGVTQAA